MTTVSLIITTYNRPDALELVLKSVRHQNYPTDQVVLADDGSTRETKDVVERWGKWLPITHVWGVDNGFRAARIRNLALLKTFGEYIIMIDGDCVIPPDFISNHLGLAKEKRIVAGSRYLYSKEFTEGLLKHPEGKRPTLLFGDKKFRTLPLGPIRDFWSQSWGIVRTCNLGLWRKDAFAVGGFDERYTGWGSEDTDFVVRLLRAGVKIRSGRYSVCVGHLHHSERERDRLVENKRLLDEVIEQKSRSSSLAARTVIGV